MELTLVLAQHHSVSLVLFILTIFRGYFFVEQQYI